MDLITLIFTALGDIAISVASWFGELFTGVASLIYTPANGTDPASLTLFGIILLISMAVTVLWSIMWLIVGMIRINPARGR